MLKVVLIWAKYNMCLKYSVGHWVVGTEPSFYVTKDMACIKNDFSFVSSVMHHSTSVKFLLLLKHEWIFDKRIPFFTFFKTYDDKILPIKEHTMMFFISILNWLRFVYHCLLAPCLLLNLVSILAIIEGLNQFLGKPTDYFIGLQNLYIHWEETLLPKYFYKV